MVGLRGRQPTKFRQAFAVWEAGPAKRYYEHTPGRPNYVARSKTDGRDENTLGDPVFPQNQKFLSQPVLSYPLKQAVWRAVSTGESSIRQASVDFKIDIRRVAAVIRLKEIEKQWRTEVRS